MSETDETPRATGFDAEALDALIQQRINEALAIQQESHRQEMEALRQSLSGGAAPSPVPAHAGGPGTEIRPTWSLAEQEEQIRLDREKARSAA